jgi:succinoglycan biosynthesis transport protein ExoP
MNFMQDESRVSWNVPAQPASGGLDWLPDLLAFVRRRWLALALCTVTAIALAICYLILATPMFTATTTLLIDTQAAALFNPGERMNGDALVVSEAVGSQVEVLSSEGVARAVVAKDGLAHDKAFLSNGRPDPLGRLTGAVTHLLMFWQSPPAQSTADEDTTGATQLLMSMTYIRRIGTTSVIDVSVRANSPTMAAKLANDIATAYMGRGLLAKSAMAQDASQWLEARSRELLDQAQTADQAVQQFKAANNIVDTDKGLMNEAQLGKLNDELAEARSTLSLAEARYKQIQSITAQGLFEGNSADALGSELIIHLRQQYLDASRQAADLSARYGADHAAVINIRNQMREMQKNIQAELTRISDSYKNAYEVALANERSLEQRLTALSREAATTNEKLVQLRGLQSSAETFRTLYESFLKRYTQAVQDQSFPISEARVVTLAAVPLHKSSPKGSLAVAIACMLGLAVGFGYAFLREAMDRTLRTAQQIPVTPGLDFIGFLPLVSPREQKAIQASSGGALVPVSASRTISARNSMLRFVSLDAFSPFAEIMRNVWLQLGRKGKSGERMKVIGCVSALPEEGKTTVAANLAQFLASTGGKTLLMDWDLRKLSLTRSLAPDVRVGFTDVLASRIPLSDAIFTDQQSGLDFLPGGAQGALPEVLNSSPSREFLASLREKYDYVVVDLPAMVASADVLAGSQLVDGVLVVVQWGSTSRQLVTETLSRLHLNHVETVGVILNKVNFTRLRRYTEFDQSTYYYAPAEPVESA